MVGLSSEYWSVRQLKWILVGTAVLVVVAVAAVWLLEHKPDKIAFDRYLDAIAAGRFGDAYGQLCPESRQTMPDYSDRLNKLLVEIGTIERRTEIRASRK